MNKIKFAENLKKFRELKGLSKEELGERVGVSGVTVGYWETGRNEPRMGKVDHIAQVLDITIDELLFDGCNEIDEIENIHNINLNDDQKRAIELILQLPTEELKMFNVLMERSLKNE